METGLGRRNSHLGSGKRVCHAVKQGEKVTCLLPRTGLNQLQEGRFQRDKGFCSLALPKSVYHTLINCLSQEMPLHRLAADLPQGCTPQPPPLFSEQHCPNARPLARDSTRQPAKHLADRGHGLLPTQLLLHKYALNIQLEFIHREQQLRR